MNLGTRMSIDVGVKGKFTPIGTLARSQGNHPKFDNAI